jgi:hypothetical protein
MAISQYIIHAVTWRPDKIIIINQTIIAAFHLRGPNGRIQTQISPFSGVQSPLEMRIKFLPERKLQTNQQMKQSGK